MIASDASIKNSDLGSNIKIYKQAEVSSSKLGSHVIIGDFSIVNHCTLGSNISVNRYNFLFRSKVGKFTYTGMNTSIRSSELGSFCSLAWNVSIGGGNHEFENVSNYPLWRYEMLGNSKMDHDQNIYLKKRHKEFGECIIGNDVWIATNAVVLRGVKVGNGAIIGAGAVVTKDVEPYSIVAGVPAKKKKMRFDNKTIEVLENIQWWNWPRKVIKENIDLIYSKKVNQDVLDKLSETSKKCTNAEH